MVTHLPPHRARYLMVGPRGEPTGEEELELGHDGGGYRVASRIRFTDPAAISCSLVWELDGNLRTRMLLITGTNGSGEEYELELALTGNGVLAHRRAPDGPTQIEMGWCPDAELDFISAAFTSVLVARSDFSHAAQRKVTVVLIASTDLIPVVVEEEYRLLGPTEWRTATGVQPARELEVHVAASGHRARLLVLDDGIVAQQQGVLELDSLELL